MLTDETLDEWEQDSRDYIRDNWGLEPEDVGDITDTRILTLIEALRNQMDQYADHAEKSQAEVERLTAQRDQEMAWNRRQREEFDSKAAGLAANAEVDLVLLRAEIDRLRKWKAEALEVLKNWDAVWKALDHPGQIGQHKSVTALAEVERLRAKVESAEAFGQRVVMDSATAKAEVLAEVLALSRICEDGNGQTYEAIPTEYVRTMIREAGDDA